MFRVDMQVDDDNVPGEIYEDEDDENDENNWRNDYPDEDEFLPEEDSDGERGMPVINIVCIHIDFIHFTCHLYKKQLTEHCWGSVLVL